MGYEAIIEKFINQAPSLILAIICLRWLASRYIEKTEELKEERKHARDSDEENIKTLIRIRELVDKLTESHKSSNQQLEEIRKIIYERTQKILDQPADPRGREERGRSSEQSEGATR